MKINFVKKFFVGDSFFAVGWKHTGMEQLLPGSKFWQNFSTTVVGRRKEKREQKHFRVI